MEKDVLNILINMTMFIPHAKEARGYTLVLHLCVNTFKAIFAHMRVKGLSNGHFIHNYM